MNAQSPPIGILLAQSLPDLVVGRLTVPGAEVELCAFPEVRTETISVTEDHSILSLGLSSLLKGSEGRFPHMAAPRFLRFGTLSFRPAGVPVEIRVGGGACHTIRCRFDRERLKAGGIVPETLDAAQLAACFDIHAPRIEEAMMRLAEELGNPGPDTIMLVEALIGMILVDLSRHMAMARRQGQATRHGGLAPRHLRRVLSRMDQSGPSPTIEELARICGLSHFHFIRAFRTTMGQSPAAYAQRMRMGQARALLAADDRPIAAIARELGYAGVPAFSTAFRRDSGRSPSQWRATLR